MSCAYKRRTSFEERMANITVKYLFSFRELLGRHDETLHIKNPSVKKVLEKLFAIYGDELKQRIVDPATGEIRFISAQPRNVLFSPKAGHIRKDSLKAIRIIINGRLVYNIGGIGAKLKEGDIVTIF